MQKLAEINNLISNLIAFDITYNESVSNYKYNKEWVTDICGAYFGKKIEILEELLDKNIDYGNFNHINFLKVIFKEIVDAHSEQRKFDHENYSYFSDHSKEWGFDLNFPKSEPIINTSKFIKPKNNPSELRIPSPINDYDDRDEYIVEIIKGFFNINDNFDEREINSFLIKNNYIEEHDLELVYARAHLSYVISLRLQMINVIARKIRTFLDVIIKMEKYSDSTEAKIDLINPNDVKIEFAMEKQDIAIFFHTLYEIKFIKTDTDSFRNSQSKLKAFINQSNIYYKFKNELTRVGDIKKQFTALNNEEINRKESDFIINLMSRLETRLEEVQSRKDKR